MKKLLMFILLMQISFCVLAQNKNTATKELRKTRYCMLVGVSSFAAGTWCTYNAFEAHNKYKFNYTRGYVTDIDEYFRTFKNQMFFSAGFTSAGVVLQCCALYHFNKYRDLMNDKITFKVTPGAVGIALKLQ